MQISDNPNFDAQLTTFRALIKLRQEPNRDLDQAHLTEESILKRIQIFQNLELSNNQRVLAIGDSDMSTTAISIFGKPLEVVVVDIDRRMSEILFEAAMEYDLPIRFVYHDMRIKLIEILYHQYTVVIMEPPPTTPGFEVFISRAIQCIQSGYEANIFISVPQDPLLQNYFHKYCHDLGISIEAEFIGINHYINGYPSSDLIRIKIPSNIQPTVKSHWIEPFYSYEVNQDYHEYRCLCNEIIKVGLNLQFETLDELKMKGHSCGHKDVFSFNSKIPLL